MSSLLQGLEWVVLEDSRHWGLDARTIDLAFTVRFWTYHCIDVLYVPVLRPSILVDFSCAMANERTRMLTVQVLCAATAYLSKRQCESIHIFGFVGEKSNKKKCFQIPPLQKYKCEVQCTMLKILSVNKSVEQVRATPVSTFVIAYTCESLAFPTCTSPRFALS